MRRAWNALALLGLIGMFAVLAALWGQAPDRVPSHFNAAGEADRWTGPYRLWFMPAVAAPVYLGLLLLARRARTDVADALYMTSALVMLGSLWMHAEVWMIAMGAITTPGPASFVLTAGAGLLGSALAWWRYRKVA